jgi:hypothetical protein
MELRDEYRASHRSGVDAERLWKILRSTDRPNGEASATSGSMVVTFRRLLRKAPQRSRSRMRRSFRGQGGRSPHPLWERAFRSRTRRGEGPSAAGKAGAHADEVNDALLAFLRNRDVRDLRDLRAPIDVPRPGATRGLPESSAVKRGCRPSRVDPVRRAPTFRSTDAGEARWITGRRPHRGSGIPDHIAVVERLPQGPPASKPPKVRC